MYKWLKNFGTVLSIIFFMVPVLLFERWCQMKTKNKVLTIAFVVATILMLFGSYADYQKHAAERGNVEVVK